MRTRARHLIAGLVVTGVAAALGACGAPDQEAAHGSVQVHASFYPLQFVAERVGGDHVDVTTMTPPTVDPHNLELSPAQLRDLGSADLVVYLSGFQNAVDEAVTTIDQGRVLDVAAAARMERSPNGLGAASREGAQLDPHFWLDPTRLAAVADELAAQLSATDPDGAEAYAANAAGLGVELEEIDRAYREGLASCAGATLVVSHEAFGYLAERYDLVQVGISGINPEAEPSPARLREVRAVIEDSGVRTLFFEVLTSPKVTQALADDAGVRTDRLDPVEGHVDADYLDVMRANLTALERGLVCDR